MVSPLFEPQTVILTYALLGWKFSLARVVFSLAGAIILGIAFNYFEKNKIKGFVSPDKFSYAECKSCPPAYEVGKIGFWKSFLAIVKELGKYFLLGMFIASLLTVIIPEETIPKYIGSSGWFAYFVAVLLGIPIYICEGEEIPITLALLKLGLGSGPAFSFLFRFGGNMHSYHDHGAKVIGRKPVLLHRLLVFICRWSRVNI